MLIGGCVGLVVTSATSIIAPYFFGRVVDAAQHSMSEFSSYAILQFLLSSC